MSGSTLSSVVASKTPADRPSLRLSDVVYLVRPSEVDPEAGPKDFSLTLADLSDTIIARLLTGSLSADDDGFVRGFVSPDEFVSGRPGQDAFIHNAGRFYLYNADRWSTNANSTYSSGQFQFLQALNTSNGEVIFPWTMQGEIIPPGYKVMGAVLRGRRLSGTFDDVELMLTAIYPVDPLSHIVGINNNNQIRDETLWSGLFLGDDSDGGPRTSAISFLHYRTIMLATPFIPPRGSHLAICARAVPEVASTAFFGCSYSWILQKM